MLIEELEEAEPQDIDLNRLLQRAENFVKKYNGKPSERARRFVRMWHEKHG